MDLLLKIEGKGESVRDFITFMKTDERYAIYASARYTLSPERDVVEFTFQERHVGGEEYRRGANYSDWKRGS